MKEYAVREIPDDTPHMTEGFLRTWANNGWSLVAVWPKGERWLRVILERENPDESLDEAAGR